MARKGDRPRTSPAAAEVLASTARVLDAVRIQDCHFRAEIADFTGLSSALVARRVTDLLASGLLEESESVSGKVGRPAGRLSLGSTLGHLLVADIGVTSVHAALTDLAGKVVDSDWQPLDVSQGPEPVMATVESLLDALHERGLRTYGDLWGIGIGLPAPVDFATGVPTSPPLMPGWDAYPVRDRLATRFSTQVWVDNEVNLMALGEWRHGVARGAQNVVFIKIGSGVGAGLISEGHLHRGSAGCAGSLPTTSGGTSLVLEAQRAGRESRSPYLRQLIEANQPITVAQVALGQARGDEVCSAILAGVAQTIGSVIAQVVDLLNPSLIVIGGRVAQDAGDVFLAGLRQAVYAQSLALATRDLRIVRSELSGLAGVVGAADMVLERLFALDNLGETFRRAAHAAVELHT